MLLGPAYAVWSPGQNPNDQSVNFLYDDLPTEGGYNHFELRRSKRAYSLPGVFNAGDPAPPMEAAEEWLEEVVYSGGP